MSGLGKFGAGIVVIVFLLTVWALAQLGAFE